jgi:MFS family permease
LFASIYSLRCISEHVFYRTLGPILPVLVEQYGGNAFTIRLLFSSYSFAQFLSAPSLGAISDRYGRRVVMLLSLCGAVLDFSIFAISGALTDAQQMMGALADALVLDQQVSLAKARQVLDWQPQEPSLFDEVKGGAYAIR